MSVTGCTHPESDRYAISDAYGQVVMEWCELCGSVRWGGKGLIGPDKMVTPGGIEVPCIAWKAPSGLLLPGWTCKKPDCRAFNGSAKEVLTHCRACDTPRLTGDTARDTTGGAR